MKKLVESHTIRELDNEGHVLLYIDRSILNEYTSPQAFSGLRERGRTVRHPDTFLLNIDHVNPTRSQRDVLMTDPGGQLQVDYFRENAADFGITLFDVLDPRQGIEHVVAHEQGLVMPGMVIAAGIVTRQPTVHLARWALVSGRRKLNICWPRRRWFTASSKPCA